MDWEVEKKKRMEESFFLLADPPKQHGIDRGARGAGNSVGDEGEGRLVRAGGA